MKLIEVLEVVSIDKTIMVIVYNDGDLKKFVGNSMELIYSMAEYKYRKVFNIHAANDILTIFVE